MWRGDEAVNYLLCSWAVTLWHKRMAPATASERRLKRFPGVWIGAGTGHGRHASVLIGQRHAKLRPPCLAETTSSIPAVGGLRKAKPRPQSWQINKKRFSAASSLATPAAICRGGNNYTSRLPNRRGKQLIRQSALSTARVCIASAPPTGSTMGTCVWRQLWTQTSALGSFAGRNKCDSLSSALRLPHTAPTWERASP